MGLSISPDCEQLKYVNTGNADNTFNQYIFSSAEE